MKAATTEENTQFTDEVQLLKEELERIRAVNQQLEQQLSINVNVEEALRRNQERLRMLNKATHDIIWDWDLITNKLEWNEAVEAAIGKKRIELPPTVRSWHLHIHPEDKDRVLESIHHAIDSGKDFWSMEYRFGPENGPWRVYFDRGYIARNAEGKAWHMLGSMLDLTERKETEEALKRSEKLMQNILEVLPVGIFISDEKGSIVKTNRAAETIWAGTKHVPISSFSAYRGWWRKNGQAIDAGDWAFARAFLKGETSTDEEIDIECFDGTKKTILNFAAPVKNERDEVVSSVAAIMDITERVQAEEALKQSEERFRMMANTISQLAWMADSKGWIYWYNQRWFDYTGTTLEEMEGWGWKKVHHPDHLDRVVKKIQHSWDSGEPWEDLFPLKGKNGQYRWFLSRAIPVKNEKGKVVQWFGTNTDVTDQQEYEERLKNDNQLFEDLLYIVAHDLKGPIGNMYMALDIIKEADYQNKLKLIGHFDQLVERLEVTINGVTDILKVRKTNKAVSEQVNFESVLKDLLEEYREELGLATVTTDFKKESIHYLQAFVCSILKNLVSNAIKYCRTDVPLSIEVTTRAENDYVVLVIKDNGIGIDLDKYGKQLFSPFHRINPSVSNGTGVGLYIVKKMIEQNGGRIEVISHPGEGTAFHCYLKEYF